MTERKELKKLVDTFMDDVAKLMDKFHNDSKGGLITKINIKYDIKDKIINSDLRVKVSFPD